MWRDSMLGFFFATLAMSAASLAQAPSLTLLGVPPGRQSAFASGLSADGRTVVGYTRDFNGTDRAYSWTEAGGFNEFGSLPGVPTPTQAQGVSADGSVVIGFSETSDGPGTPLRASSFRYSGGTYQTIPNAPGYNKSEATGISGNASVVVGKIGVVGGPFLPMRWTPGAGMQHVDLPQASDLAGWFTGVSRDGSTAIGVSLRDFDGFEAYSYSQSGGWRHLPAPAGTGSVYDSRSYGVNADGSLIVGSVQPSGARSKAVLWRDGSAVDMGTFGVDWSMTAVATSDDGSIIVGGGHRGDIELDAAGIWINGSGAVNLQDYLASLGVFTPAGWRLAGCGEVTPDGRTILGVASRGSVYQPFIATIPSPSGLAMATLALALTLGRRRRRFAPLIA